MPRKKILAVASQGGHLIQLMRLKPVFDRHQTTYVTNQKRDGMKENFIIVADANRNDKLKLVLLLWQMFWIVVRTRPDVVISSGAAPGFFALLFGKLCGAKTIWLDSIANAEELSLSGKRAGKFADLWLTQWPELSSVTGPYYSGSVL
ncbi:MAG: UDP-N-acetylglucosamine--LPS N-acetylglucosamine transferase [Pseudomonadota bacterium]